jgi:hypothetical protein
MEIVIMKITLVLLLGLVLGFSATWATNARAMEIPSNTEYLEHPEKVIGKPLAYIQLAPDAKVPEGTPLDELQKENGCLVGYQEIALTDWNTDHPLLVTQVLNLRLKRLVKLYINWNQVSAVQILDPKVTFPLPGGKHDDHH